MRSFLLVFSAAKIGLKSTSPNPGPRLFGSFAWKWRVYSRFARITSGRGAGSADIAFTSKPLRRLGTVHSLVAFAFVVLFALFRLERRAGLRGA